MNQKPVIFLAFANDAKRPLDELVAEGNEIYTALGAREGQGHFELKKEAITTTENLGDYFLLYGKRMVIFHFSGHAGADVIQLADKTAIATGIASYKAISPKLKLVFLNACNTKDQVKALMEKGVSAVIATSAPLNDTKARIFSTAFYKALAMPGNTLQYAFDFAKAEVEKSFAGMKFPVQKLNRAVYFDFDEDLTQDNIFGLYIDEEKAAEVSAWQLPAVPVVEANKVIFAPNELIVRKLLQALAPYDLNVKKIITQMQGGNQVAWNTRTEAILKCLPYPIGIRMQNLLAKNREGNYIFNIESPHRPMHLIYAYKTLMQMCTYTLLAEIWEKKLRLEQYGYIQSADEFVVTQELRDTIDAFLDNDTRQLPNYQSALMAGLSILKNNEQLIKKLEEEKGLALHTFVQEISKNFTQPAGVAILTSAQSYFSALYQHIQNNTLAEVAQHSKLAEEELSEVMGISGFIGSYIMTSVQDISVIKYRHFIQPKYKNTFVKLVVALESAIRTAESMNSVLLMDNKSVLWVKFNDLEEIESFLNLSPFVIDKNAYLAEKTEISNLYFFSHTDADAFCFYNVTEPQEPIWRVPKNEMHIQYDDNFLEFIDWEADMDFPKYRGIRELIAQINQYPIQA